MQDLIIYGARYANLVPLIDTIGGRNRQYRLIGFIDDTPELRGAVVAGHPVLGGREVIPKYAADCLFAHNVQGSYEGARTVARAIAGRGGRVVESLAHPDVDLFDVTYGRNFVAMAGTIFGVGVRLGEFVKVRVGSTVESGVEIADFAFVAAGVHIGRDARIGAGAFLDCGVHVRPGVTIGDRALVAAGAVVHADVPEGATVAGSPARPLARRA